MSSLVSVNVNVGNTPNNIATPNNVVAPTNALSSLSIPPAGTITSPMAALMMVTGSMNALMGVATGRMHPSAALTVPLMLGVTGLLRSTPGALNALPHTHPASGNSISVNINPAAANNLGAQLKPHLGASNAQALSGALSKGAQYIHAQVAAGNVSGTSALVPIAQSMSNLAAGLL